jgi:hypothetical protein
MIVMRTETIRELENYCEKYNIPIDNLVDVISDLKVIPMIRGKAFEYTVASVLKRMLSRRTWKVENPHLNAQPGVHDIDVLVTKLSNRRRINVECKLSKNDSFNIENGIATIRVKCMRSRTFSDNAAATRMARSYGITRELLLMHADSYRKKDFDFVVTSVGNSLWATDEMEYVFSGTEAQFNFLRQKFPSKFSTFRNFQKDSFNFLLFAQSKDICACTENGLVCNRKKCIKNGTRDNCGFIPNYPIVNLNNIAAGAGPWKVLDNIKEAFSRFLG